ncbi:TPR-like protein [Calocera cornea HHB12733]|uniref:TPR-like protein n=1 Tax=Calocera cornea HHB12733 TaxID=1353952 RepID=A0A165F3E2_9BASI|nr:TPR-like protein [Calocera cornea HHB12733]
MSTTSSTIATPRASLKASFTRWKGKAGMAVDPVRKCLRRTAFQVLGIWDLVQSQQEEYQDLVRRLTLITEQVLDRVPADRRGDETTQKTVNALREVANQVERFLKGQHSASRRGTGANCGETVVVQSANVGFRLDQLQIQSAASGASQGYLPAPLPMPNELPIADVPPEPAVFFGRDELVESIVVLLLQDQTCRIPILGPGGMGKTSLAAAILNDTRIKTKYRQNIRFVSCEGVVSADGIVQALVASLGLQSSSNLLEAVLHNLLARVRTLLVLDNLETAWDSVDKLNVEQLLGKLAEIPTLSLIITMRGAIRPAGVKWSDQCLQPLRPLPLDAARQVWIQIAPTSDSKLDQLLTRLDGLPLAITLMATQGQLLSPAELLEAYTVEKTALMDDTDGGRLTSLDVSIQLSINSRTMSTNPDALKLLSLLSLLPDGVPLAILHLTAHTISNSRKCASTLLAVALVSMEKDRIKALSPIRDFIAVRYPPTNDSLRKMRRYFAAIALKGYVIPTDRAKEAIDMLSMEFRNINSVLLYFWSASPASDDIQDALIATVGLADFSRLAYYGDCLPLLHLAKTTLEHAGDRTGAAQCLQLIGELLHNSSRYIEAVRTLQEAKMMFRATDNHLLAAQCTRVIGDSLRMLCRYEEALETLMEALTAYEKLKYDFGVAQCTDNIGRTLFLLHRNQDALEMLSKAMVMFRTLGDTWAAVQTVQGTCYVLTAMHRYTEAIATLDHARPVFENLGNKLGVAQCIESMGDVLSSLNRYEEAIVKLDEAKGAYAVLGNSLGVAQCTANAANLLRMLNRNDQALQRLEMAQKEFEGIDYPLGIGKCKKVRAQIFAIQGRKQEAERLLTEAIEIFQDMGRSNDVERCQLELLSVRGGERLPS